MIGVIDYGIGNVQAFLNTLSREGAVAGRVSTKAEVKGATHLVLPGVGSFDHAMDRFEHSGLRGVVEEMVFEKHVPLLGVCVGMQMLARGSDEGHRQGLGWIPGWVKSLSSVADQPSSLPLPHMGWNDVISPFPHPLLNGFEEMPRFYFLHSFYFEAESSEHVIGRAKYGREFPCAVAAGRILGVQFHPEKSHHFGGRLLRNFSEL